MLENKLAHTTTKSNLSIAHNFLKMKTLCSVISLLDPDGPISAAQMKRYITCGLRF